MAQVLRSIHVGVGGRGRTHWRLYHTSPLWEVAALVDLSQEALEAAQSELGMPSSRCFNDLNQALAEVEADAVVISTPPGVHTEQVEAALNAGLHVFVEKPFTLDLAEAQGLVQKADELGLKIVVGQQDRFNPPAMGFMEVVKNGDFGELGYCVVNHFKSRRVPYHNSPHMHLWAQGVHQIDTLLALVGSRVVRVTGESMTPNWCDWPSESTVFALLEFENGVRAHYMGTSNARSSRSSLSIRAEYERAAVTYDSSKGPVIQVDGHDLEPTTFELPDAAGNQYVCEQFHHYITTGEEPEISGRNNLHVVEIVDAIIRSTAERRSVDLR